VLVLDPKKKLVEYVQNDEMRALFKRILEHIEKMKKKYPDYEHADWFEWYDVAAPTRVLNRLVLDGILEIPLKTNRSTHYRLKDPELVRKVIEEYESFAERPSFAEGGKTPEIPEDLFDIIEGYERIKKIFLKSIKSERVVHILLVGPPATAKTLFLMEIERLEGSVMTTASSSTKAGIRDILLEKKPRFLLIDELEKIADTRDLSVLLTLMESQRLIIARHRQHVDIPLKCWVFAAANSTRGIPRELLSRFLVFHLKPYTEEQFVKVSVNVLVKREGVSEDLARYIAFRVLRTLGSKDVRDAIKVARLAETKEDVDFVIETMKMYRPH